MTNDELLATGYPDKIDRIRELASKKFLSENALSTAPAALATAFTWSDTKEGREFWNDLYKRGHSR